MGKQCKFPQLFFLNEYWSLTLTFANTFYSRHEKVTNPICGKIEVGIFGVSLDKVSQKIHKDQQKTCLNIKGRQKFSPKTIMVVVYSEASYRSKERFKTILRNRPQKKIPTYFIFEIKMESEGLAYPLPLPYSSSRGLQGAQPLFQCI